MSRFPFNGRYNKSSHELPTVAAPSTPNERVEQALPPAPKKSLLSRLGIVGIVSVLAAILIIGSALYVFSGIASSKNRNNLTTTLSRTTTAQKPVHATVTPTPQNGLYIPGTYNGSITIQRRNKQRT